MKKNWLFFSLFSLAVIFFLILQENRSSDKIYFEQAPNNWFFRQRAYPSGEINQDIYIQSLKLAKQFKEQAKLKKDTSNWVFAGPINIGGRLTDVEMHPSDMQTIYAGAASGGIFKSTDQGISWIPVFDDALSLSIGDIAIAPSDPEIIYVGTGEANAGGGSQTYDGIGIYKSINGAQTWEYLGLAECRNVGRIVVHPVNPDIVYVAAMGNLFAENPERGIYKTTDGGQSWQNILFISDSTGGIDIVLHPQHPDTLYASMWQRVRRPDRESYGGITSGIYRSYNGGQDWEELTNGLPSPGNNVGRIGIDISKSDPNVLYSIYADAVGYFQGVFKSTDNGDSWIQTNDASLANCYQSYGWWFGRISIDPINPDIIYVIGFDLYKTINGGNSWTNISSPYVHVDHHGFYSHPLNHNFLINGNDGGLYISENGGNSWTWINNLPVTQFYTCDIDRQHPERLYGGTQDNGTNRTLTGNNNDWANIFGGDGFYVLVDPENNNYIYAEYQYGNFARSTNGGTTFNYAMSGISSSDRKNWNTPVVFDPTDPQVLYYGANRLYKSTNRAASWSAISTDLTNGPGVNIVYGTITTISVSPINPEIIYVGTDDGNVWVSSTTGTGWENLSSGLPDRWVTRITADPVDENTAYVTFSGYRWNEFLPHIFRTIDKGSNWEDISGNLPEVPVNDIIVDPENNSKLYIATDVGTFVTHDLGLNWEMLGANLPNVPVTNMKLHNETRTLVAATFGRSMYRYDLNQDTLSTPVNDVTMLTNTISADVFPNPFSSFVKIVIYNRDKEGKITIEICDGNGQFVSSVYEGNIEKGINNFSWKVDRSEGLARGIYFLKVKVGRQNLTKKLIYLSD